MEDQNDEVNKREPHSSAKGVEVGAIDSTKINCKSTADVVLHRTHDDLKDHQFLWSFIDKLHPQTLF